MKYLLIALTFILCIAAIAYSIGRLKKDKLKTDTKSNELENRDYTNSKMN